MEIDIKKMKEVYGEEIEEMMIENEEIIKANIKTLKEYGFKDIEGIIEMYPSIMMNFPKQFRGKVEKLKNIYGENFVNKIENDISLLEIIDK